MPHSGLYYAAIDYVERGYSVLPLRPRAKLPVTSGGVKDATTDIVKVSQWWTSVPELNIGIACGRHSLVSGLVVVDIDEEAGEVSLARLEKKYDELPPTQEVLTGKGRHLYFRVVYPMTIKNSAGRLGKQSASDTSRTTFTVVS